MLRWRVFENSFIIIIAKAAPEQCKLTGASWNQTEASMNQLVSLAITGNDCEGMEVLFRPLEDDVFSGDDIVAVNPPNALLLD